MKYLSMKESNRIRYRLLQELNTYSITKNGYWYPLCEVSKEINCISFYSENLNNDNWKLLFHILKNEQIKKIYEIQELVEIVRICEVDDYFLDYDEEDGYDMLYMSECYWVDEDHKLLIYTSHEGTISFCGNIVNNILENNELKLLIKDMYYQKLDD